MQQIINSASQILFCFAALFFAIYSMVAMYTLNVSGHSKSFAVGLSIFYSLLAVGFLSWGFVVIF